MTTEETSEYPPVDKGCVNGCNAPFGVRCSVCNTENRMAEATPVPFTIDHLLAHLQIEADFVADRFVVTRGQRLVLRDLLQRAHDEIERLNDENEALRIDLAAAYCRMDDMEGLNDE